MRFLQLRSPATWGRLRWAGGRGIFRRDTRGSAALEFAIVGLPFFAVIFAIIEMAVDFMIYAEIDTAVQRSVADIRSGIVQMQSMTASQFKSQVLCPKMPGLTCSSILLNVATMPGVGDWLAWPADSIDPAIQKWCPGGPSDAVLVQVGYPVPLASMIWAGSLSTQDGTRYYVSSAGLRNDPYGVPFSAAAGC